MNPLKVVGQCFKEELLSSKAFCTFGMCCTTANQ